MKKIFTIILVAAVALISCFPAFADGYDPEQIASISAKKTVTPLGGSDYLLTLETFVKGEDISKTAKSTDMDIVLVLDVSGSMKGDALVNLKSACDGFISTIASDAAKHHAEHRISIVKFASAKTENKGDDTYYDRTYSYSPNYSQVVSEFKSVSSSSNVDALKQDINGLHAEGATQSNYGMELAKKVLSGDYNNHQTRAAIKCVVMFTDGTPTSYKNFDVSIANGAVSASKNMKQEDEVVVYTVGLWANTPSTNVTNYMEAVSSNYPNAETYTNRGSRVSKDKNYYFPTADQTELAKIFQKIGEDILGQGAGINFGDDKVVLRDIVTPQFVLPSGANSIVVKVADIDHINGISTSRLTWDEGDCVWKEPVTVWRDGKNVSEDYKDVVVSGPANNTIDVQGFDFSANWVGLMGQIEGTAVKSVYTRSGGKKLIIEIVIQFDQDKDGGVISTNDEKSGIYVGNNPTDALVKYQVVPATVYTPLPLIITKEKGNLENGESILYKVVRFLKEGEVYIKDASFADMTVALTKGNSEDLVLELGKLPTVYVKDGTEYPYYYEVTEDYTWAWAHKSTTPQSVRQTIHKSLSNYVAQSFDFSAAPDTAGIIKHDEDSVNNEFAK